jgi:SAM-dependent methyltransferase
LNSTNTNAVVHFDKYDERGAYHWLECNPKRKEFNPPLVARYQIVIDEVARIEPRKEVLDIGCGDAYLMSRLSPYCECVTGIDPEPKAVELANDLLSPFGNCSARIGDCYNLPFEEKSFDIVVLTDVIEHLKSPGDCLAEIARVLRHSGSLIVTTPKSLPNRKWDERHEREYKPEELSNLLHEYFNQVNLSYFWPLWWSNFYRTRLGWRFCKSFARLVSNPFMRSSSSLPEHFGQLCAVVSRPKGSNADASKS